MSRLSLCKLSRGVLSGRHGSSFDPRLCAPQGTAGPNTGRPAVRLGHLGQSNSEGHRIVVRDSLFGDDYINHVGQGLLTLYNVTMSNLKQYEQ